MIQLITFIIRLAIVAIIWSIVWRQIKPKSQAMRIIRAGILVVSMLGVYAAVCIGIF